MLEVFIDEEIRTNVKPILAIILRLGKCRYHVVVVEDMEHLAISDAAMAV